MIDNKTIKSLEFNKILEILSSFAVCDVTKTEILKTVPAQSLPEAELLQKQTAEAYITKTKYNLSPVVSFDEIDEILSKANIGAILQMGELLKIARVIRAARIAKKEIEGTGEDIVSLKNIVSTLFIDNELEKIIGDSILSENEMKDEASDKLRSVRRKIKTADARLKEKLNSYTRSGEVSKYLQDNLITIRNGRFVLPVKSECRSFIPGLIHDQSASGATVFIEPLPVIDLNNEIKSLKLEEAQEIERILTILSGLVSSCAQRLENCRNVCIMLDIIYAKCAFSIDFKCARPIINSSGEVNFINARHPLIDKNKVVPVNVGFGKDFKLLLITGPNTGGKTVALKTVGLFCLMAYCGIPLPCDDGSTLPVFDSIFCDIGDEQSILNSLSTFSSHIVNLSNIMNNITPHSLVLLDELGGGTDPSEGAALAIGIIKYLELMGARGILTTHYGKLKEYALISKNLKNGCMQFDEETLSPTFKLIIGIPGVSNALKIAQNYGLSDYIIKEAKNSLETEKVQFELVLQNAEKVKYAALKEKEELERLRYDLEEQLKAVKKERSQIEEKLNRINLNAQAEIKKIVSKNSEKAESILDEMKELLKAADDKALFTARQKMRELEDMQYLISKDNVPVSFKSVQKESLKIGMKVLLAKIGTTAEVRRIFENKNEAEVLSGNVILNVKISDLAELENDGAPSENFKKTEGNRKADKELPQNTLELKVLGLTVYEAIEVIYPHIVSSTGQNVVLKIIHGKGTGALAAGIRSFLKNTKEVKNFRVGGYYEGGAGVTVAEII